MGFIDVNECLDNNAGCSDNCTNTDGSYYCSCFSGFELSSDNHTCEGMYHTELWLNFLFRCILLIIYNPSVYVLGNNCNCKK